MYGKCKICGCTANNACNHADFGSCWWVNDDNDLCSHCYIDELKDNPAVERPAKRLWHKPKLTAKSDSSTAEGSRIHNQDLTILTAKSTSGTNCSN
jgi:hypothetical protein